MAIEVSIHSICSTALMDKYLDQIDINHSSRSVEVVTVPSVM